MVPSADADRFVKFLTKEFYSKRSTYGKNIEQLIFTTSPSEGACMFVSRSDYFNDLENQNLPAITQLL